MADGEVPGERVVGRDVVRGVIAHDAMRRRRPALVGLGLDEAVHLSAVDLRGNPFGAVGRARREDRVAGGQPEGDTRAAVVQVELVALEAVDVMPSHAALLGRQAEVAEHVVERAVLLEQHDDVIDVRQGSRRGRRRPVRWGHVEEPHLRVVERQ